MKMIKEVKLVKNFVITFEEDLKKTIKEFQKKHYEVEVTNLCVMTTSDSIENMRYSCIVTGRSDNLTGNELY